MANETTQQEDPVEILEPGAEVKTYVLGTGEAAWELTQAPLNFFQKLELFSVLGTALDQALSGPNPLSLNELLDVPDVQPGEDFKVQDIQDADQFIRAIAKLVQYAPDLLMDVYCIILSVPRNRRETAKHYMQLPVAEGGLSDDDGFAILDTFFEQNWDVLKDFFSQRIRPLMDRLTDSGSDQSKPSKATARRTRKPSTSS